MGGEKCGCRNEIDRYNDVFEREKLASGSENNN